MLNIYLKQSPFFFLVYMLLGVFLPTFRPILPKFTSCCHSSTGQMCCLVKFLFKESFYFTIFNFNYIFKKALGRSEDSLLPANTSDKFTSYGQNLLAFGRQLVQNYTVVTLVVCSSKTYLVISSCVFLLSF